MAEQVEVKAVLKGLRISPRKVGEVASLVRRRSANDALVILSNTQRKAAEPVSKLIKSAIANAKHNESLDVKALDIGTIMVTEAATMKRIKFDASGRRQARPRRIAKRSSHVTVVLIGTKPAQKTVAKPKAAAKPAKVTGPKKSTAKKEAKK